MLLVVILLLYIEILLLVPAHAQTKTVAASTAVAAIFLRIIYLVTDRVAPDLAVACTGLWLSVILLFSTPNTRHTTHTRHTRRAHPRPQGTQGTAGGTQMPK